MPFVINQEHIDNYLIENIRDTTMMLLARREIAEVLPTLPAPWREKALENILDKYLHGTRLWIRQRIKQEIMENDNGKNF